MTDLITAEVERMRAERDAALADVARFQEERTYAIGANDGWDAAVEQGEASPAVEKAMVRFWKKLAETHNERADSLAAELAATNAREAGMRTFVEDFAAAKIDALRFPRPLSPEDEPDPVVDAEEVWSWQADAKAALAQAPAPTEEG